MLFNDGDDGSPQAFYIIVLLPRQLKNARGHKALSG
jgi:hypothetical protein